MSVPIILLCLGSLYFFARFLGYVFFKTGVPDVLFLILLGIGLGPVLGWVSPADFGRVGEILTAIALTVILFESGTALNLKTLFTSALSAGLLTTATFLATVGIVASGTGLLLGVPWEHALLMGAILGGTSSAVVIPLVKSLGLQERAATILIIESALTDVLCIVVTFALIESILSGTMNLSSMGESIGLSLGGASLLGIAAGMVWVFPCKPLRLLPDGQFMTIAFCFVVFGAAEAVGVSGAIAALTFGLTLAQAVDLFPKKDLPKMSESEKGLYREMVFVLKVFFFVYLGIGFRVPSPYIAISALLIMILIYLVRIALARFLVRGVSHSDAVAICILVPKGLAAAVLASLPLQKGIAGAELIQEFVVCAVVISIFMTAGLVPIVRATSMGAALYARALGNRRQLGSAPQG